jgi:gas vesicle protein
MANGQRSKDLLLGVIVGGAIGALTALLAAPKSGRELRNDITEQANTVSEKTQQAVHAVSDKTSEWVGKVQEAAKDVIESVRSWREVNSKEPTDEGHTADFELIDDLPVPKELQMNLK